jgi:hypothetical protein
MSWNLKAQLIETCSCTMLCPCWFGVQELMVMDQGWCDNVLVFRTLEGRSEGVTLAMRTVVMAADFPGPTLFDGQGTARLYIDDGATPEQKRELEAIFQGQKGGPMEIFAGLIAKWLPTQSEKIDIQEEGDSLTATVGTVGQAQSRTLKDEAGRAMTMQNVGFASVLQFENLTAQLAPSNSQWRDPDLPRPFETKSGARGLCVWHVN